MRLYPILLTNDLIDLSDKNVGINVKVNNLEDEIHIDLTSDISFLKEYTGANKENIKFLDEKILITNPTPTVQGAALNSLGEYYTNTSTNYKTYEFINEDLNAIKNKYIYFSEKVNNTTSYPYCLFAFDDTSNTNPIFTIEGNSSEITFHTVYIDPSWNRLIIYSHIDHTPTIYELNINSLYNQINNKDDIAQLLPYLLNKNIYIYSDKRTGSWDPNTGDSVKNGNLSYLRLGRTYISKDIIIYNPYKYNVIVCWYDNASGNASDSYSNNYIGYTNDSIIIVNYDHEHPAIGIGIYKSDLSEFSQEEKNNINNLLQIYNINDIDLSDYFLFNNDTCNDKVIIQILKNNYTNLIKTKSFSNAIADYITINAGDVGNLGEIYGIRSTKNNIGIIYNENTDYLLFTDSNNIELFTIISQDSFDSITGANFNRVSSKIAYQNEILLLKRGYSYLICANHIDKSLISSQDEILNHLFLYDISENINLLPSESQQSSNSNSSIWQSILENGKERLLSLQKEIPMFNFTFITDTHLKDETSNFKCNNTVDLFVAAAKYGQFAINCGDVTTSDNTNRINTIKNMELWTNKIKEIKCPVFTVRGNHDINSRFPSESEYDYSTNYLDSYITTYEFDAMTRYHRGNNVKYNKNDPNGCYYYQDFENYNIRVIVLNCYWNTRYNTDESHGNEQIKFLAEEALNFTNKSNPSDWGVMIFQHKKEYTEHLKEGTIGYNPIAIIEGFREGIDVSSKYNNEINCSHFATQGKGCIIAIFAGNNHDDKYYRKIKDSSATEINLIQVDNAFTEPRSYIIDDIGNENEYCVSFFSIDVINKRIYETRMGRQSYAVGGFDSSESRFGFRMQLLDPNTNERKVDRSWSYGINNNDNMILTGIDDANKN